MTWILSMLGLPTWVGPAIIVALIAAGMGGAYVKGRMDSSANCREAALQVQIAGMKRDIAMQEAADLVESRILEKLRTENAELDKLLEQYSEELLNAQTDGCDLNDSDVDRLRRLGAI
jgi:hypothetical protein